MQPSPFGSRLDFAFVLHEAAIAVSVVAAPGAIRLLRKKALRKLCNIHPENH